jgi:preprotein translocase subunit SecD
MRLSARYLIAAACAGLALLLAACGGGDDATPTPSVVKGTAVLRMTSTNVPAEVIAELQEVIKNRLAASQVTSEITLGNATELTITFDGPRDTNFVSELLVSPGVRFKVPSLDGEFIRCMDTSGNEFSIRPVQLQQDVNLPICVDAGGHRGEIIWEPAVGDLNGTPTELSGAMIQANTAIAKENDEGVFILNADFNADGKALLQQVTADLVDYPLGVFLGDSLFTSPLIQQEIDNGRITLAGATRDALEELQAVLQSGELPTPVELVSIEGQ